MLGTALLLDYDKRYECFPLDLLRPEIDRNWIKCDLLDEKSVEQAFNKIMPDIIVHCAALVNVDACEKNAEQATKMHLGTTKTLTRLCKNTKSHLIYISTDSVFDGKKTGAYIETDTVNPLNVYARTKLDGEIEALKYENSLVLRTNIFGWTKAKKSFAEWVIGSLREQKTMNMFTDMYFTTIVTYKLSNIIEQCFNKKLTGLYHAGGKDVISKYDFGMKVAELAGLNKELIVPSLLDHAKLTAPRPKNMAMDSFRLEKAIDCAMPTVAESIKMWLSNEPGNI